MKMVHKRELSLILFTVVIQIMFFYTTFHATPITDEYCFASQSRTLGVLSSFISLVNLWSPSLGYLPTLAIFSLPIAGTTISSLLISISFIALNVFFYLLGNYLFKPKNWLQTIVSYSKVFLIFSVSISIVQTSGYLNYSQLIHNPLAVLKSAFLEIFSISRDGQLMIWVSQISLTWQKNLMATMIIAIPFILARYSNGSKNRKLLLISLSILFISYGPNTESFIFLISVCLFSGYRFLNRQIDFFMIFVTGITTLGLLGLSISSGSRNRQTHFADLTLEVIFSRFGTVLIQMIVITLTVFLVLKAVSSFLSISFSPSFQDNDKTLKLTTRVTVFAGILANLFVGSFVYISTYHWISLAFLIVFWILLEGWASDKSNLDRKPVLSFLSFSLVYLMAISVFFGIAQSAHDREIAWNSRELKSGKGLPKSLPIYDLKGNLIAFDLSMKSSSIIPLEGYIEGAALACFKRLTNF